MSDGVPGKVLVVRLGAIGDVVNALVFASALKRHATPEAPVEIGWAVHDLARPLVEGHPAVDRVHRWTKGSGVAGFRALVSEVQEQGYELAVDLQRIQKSAALARLSGAERVLGYDRGRAKEASWLWARERIPPGDPQAHMVEQYLEFARYLGVEAEPVRELPSDPEADAWAEAQVERMGAAPLQLNLGASKPENRWPAERFGELTVALRRELGVPVCLTGGPADRETAEVALGVAGRTPEGVHDLVGQTSLRQLVSLSARARLYVGCDTGPMHVAAACGTPVVALFGPADPRRTGPFGVGHRVVRPASRRMDDIPVEEVLEAVRAMPGVDGRTATATPAPGS